ncbi:hypothetical protein CfE428DRAFT_5513 [Chthoniobacter flavus Ellin428]|uniref:Uncharacterized protein n=1 Tax=Chthoniobacter flavus Ellin428 TaxID=497964 RepID=B4D9C3_9BACT|nr:hypothetical protein [Chthoniobacter flavus]EDY16884.1 hypothetical protein CfE428DRAFT_5513 [Chthoniobacter flavus Ellin428]TCO87766.1 hypothetical protein EV701_12065 [Chthoniobacter flavus]
MHKLGFLFILAGLSFLLSASTIAQAGPPAGRARFELLGMLDEYEGRSLPDPAHSAPSDGFLIESFYGSEVAAANHFEKVLREFCVEESLPQNWKRLDEKETEGGHIFFGSTEITAAINTSFTADPRDPLHGVVAAEVLRSATRADMLRYVAGAYVRFGDYQSAHRAFFHAANNFSKFCVLTDFLSRLGCRHLRFYDDTDAGTAPSILVLTFRPSLKVKAVTGIRRELTAKELKAMDYSHLKEKKLPHFN